MHIMLDGGIIRGMLLSEINIGTGCGNLTSKEICEKMIPLIESSEVNLYTEIGTLIRTCDKISEELKKEEIPASTKNMLSRNVYSVRSESRNIGCFEVSLYDYDVEIGIISIFSQDDKVIRLSKYNFNADEEKMPILKPSLYKKFEKMLCGCHKKDEELLRAAYYGNTNLLITTDSRINKGKDFHRLYPIFPVQYLNNDEISELSKMNQYELRVYAKDFWRRIGEKVKSRDRSKYL